MNIHSTPCLLWLHGRIDSGAENDWFWTCRFAEMWGYFKEQKFKILRAKDIFSRGLHKRRGHTRSAWLSFNNCNNFSNCNNSIKCNNSTNCNNSYLVVRVARLMSPTVNIWKWVFAGAALKFPIMTHQIRAWNKHGCYCTPSGVLSFVHFDTALFSTERSPTIYDTYKTHFHHQRK